MSNPFEGVFESPEELDGHVRQVACALVDQGFMPLSGSLLEKGEWEDMVSGIKDSRCRDTVALLLANQRWYVDDMED